MSTANVFTRTLPTWKNGTRGIGPRQCWMILLDSHQRCSPRPLQATGQNKSKVRSRLRSQDPVSSNIAVATCDTVSIWEGFLPLPSLSINVTVCSNSLTTVLGVTIDIKPQVRLWSLLNFRRAAEISYSLKCTSKAR
ncbi:hypothetical protein AVEN_3261-1 [Araneus ventricosus]|uniref:Uncharacterized protein n=1 Tax=Araneus ventricosus TaxID=182803 RepID=A0A4Y2FNW5_ARAVE|nr:hypothetical protein AVEN_3261-1 [Araneus ventricosus]